MGIFTQAAEKSTLEGTASEQADTATCKLDHARELLATLLDYMQESHQEEFDTNHHGDGADDCSYCRAMENAAMFLDA